MAESPEKRDPRERQNEPRERGPALSTETLEGVRRRDPRALAEFFEFYFDRVYSLVARLVGDRTVAEDVTQDVFLKIHRSAGQLDPRRDPMPWLTVIAYNACRDHWRARDRRRGREAVLENDAHEGGEVMGVSPSPEAHALHSEQQEAVERALMGLPEDLRVVVILRDYHDMRHERIARLVGASEAAVRKRYSRALARLAEQLKGYWND